jgi:hypothetical protein
LVCAFEIVAIKKIAMIKTNRLIKLSANAKDLLRLLSKEQNDEEALRFALGKLATEADSSTAVRFIIKDNED